MMEQHNVRARIMFVSTNGKQCVLEGNFTDVSIGDQFVACVAIGKREPAANLIIGAIWGGLAIADIIVYDSVNPWDLLGWEVTCE